VGPRFVGRQESEYGKETEAQPEEFSDEFEHGRGASNATNLAGCPR
jgi:hypothetical protein